MIVFTFAIFYIVNQKTNDNYGNVTTQSSNSRLDESTKYENGKISVVFFSAQNHTREVARKIANNLNSIHLK